MRKKNKKKLKKTVDFSFEIYYNIYRKKREEKLKKKIKNERRINMNEIISKLYAAVENSEAMRNLEVDETAEVNVTLTIAEIYSILNVIEEQ